MKKKLLGVGIVALLISLMTFLIVMAQSSDKKIKPPLIERYEKAAKAKETGFKQVNKSKDKRGNQEYTVLAWTKGDDFVDIDSLELNSVEEAAAAVNAAVNFPVAVPVPRTKLTDLGDEAYISITYKGFTQMFIRKGNVYLRLNASSPKLAKRFARHLVDSIDAD